MGERKGSLMDGDGLKCIRPYRPPLRPDFCGTDLARSGRTKINWLSSVSHWLCSKAVCN